jgi:hypothetical protein
MLLFINFFTYDDNNKSNDRAEKNDQRTDFPYPILRLDPMNFAIDVSVKLKAG